MGVFGTVVEPAPRLLAAGITDHVHCRPVGAQPVGHDDIGIAISLHRSAQESQRCLAIPAPSDIGLEHFTLVIDGAPEVVKLAVDFDENLVEMPGPIRVVLTLNSPFPDLSSEHRPEPVPPEADRLVRDIDAPFVEQVLDVPKRERKPDVHHHRQADDLGRSLEIFERITHRQRLGNYRSSLKAKFL